MTRSEENRVPTTLIKVRPHLERLLRRSATPDWARTRMNRVEKGWFSAAKNPASPCYKR